MARPQLPSVSETAAQILREIAAEERIKVAEMAVVKGTHGAYLTSQEAQAFMKVAAACRTIDTANPEINYTDLYHFMAQANAR